MRVARSASPPPRQPAWRVTAGLAVALTAVALSAQEQPVFRLRTDLVPLHVMVVDKQGHHLSGLTKDDFELHVAGKRVDVAVLAENRNARPAMPSLSTARSDVASNETVQRDTIIMLVLDDVHIRRDSTEAARAAAARFVEGIAGRAQVAVLFTSGKPGLEFTTDTQAILAAIQGLTGRENAMVGRGQTMWPGRTANMDPSQGARGASPQRGPDVQAQAGKDLLDSTMQQSLAKLPKNDGRRRAIVLISEGHITKEVSAVAASDPGADYSSAALPEKGRYTSPTPTGVYRILGGFVESIRKTGASVYAIDPRGKATMGQEGYLGADDFLNQDDVARQRQTSLRRYTEETGGFAVVDTNSVVTGAERIVDDLNNYYVLGFTPPNPKDTKMHRVEVRVKRPGLEVRHRLVYQHDTSQPSGPRPKDPLAALAASPIPSGDLPLRVWATTVAPASPKAPARLALWIESPTGPIVEYGVYPFDVGKKREVGPPVARTLKGAVPRLVPIECPPLPPGTYQLRVAARTASAGGSAYLTVEIPSFTNVRLAITGLVIGQGFDSRTDVAPLPFAPTLSREFVATSLLRIGFDVWQPGAPEPVGTVIAVEDAAGQVVERIETSVAGEGKRRVDAALSLDRLAVGAYALKVTATSPSGSTATSIAFRIR
jgi:VWFA-related protein